MTDKTREDFEAWAKPRHYTLEWADADGPFKADYTTMTTSLVYRGWEAAAQQSAARIAALEAEVLALRKDAERWYTFLATRPTNTHAAIIQAIDDAAVRKGGGV